MCDAKTIPYLLKKMCIWELKEVSFQEMLHIFCQRSVTVDLCRGQKSLELDLAILIPDNHFSCTEKLRVTLAIDDAHDSAYKAKRNNKNEH